jgi:glycerophosphoryl diester phosphodiesterase
MNLFLQPRSQPLIIAHRGSSATAPENTLAAFRLAVEQEADAIELDVDLTRDGQLIVMHDATVDRTTNGHGRVSDLTLDEIERLDAGTWKSPEFKGQRVPLLEEVFEELGRWLLINVEIKGMAIRGSGLEQKLAALIAKYDLINRVIVSSFNPFALRRVKRSDRRLACGLLVEPELPIFLREAWLTPLIPHLDARHPHHSQVNKAAVDHWHERGLFVNAWTANEVSTIRALISAGVDGIIGDDPVLIREILQPPSGVFELPLTRDS